MPQDHRDQRFGALREYLDFGYDLLDRVTSGSSPALTSRLQLRRQRQPLTRPVQMHNGLDHLDQQPDSLDHRRFSAHLWL